MTSLELRRTVRAPREQVWQAWTDADRLAAWFWPERFATTCSFDPQVGGTFRIASEVVGMAVSGDVVAVEAPERLVITWRWDGDAEETLVTVELHDAADGATEVVVLHERMTSDLERDNHREGWVSCLDRLEPALLG